MAFNEVYRRQVELLLRLLPRVAEQDCFALKGGTAINLFVRDMPRLSVDIDLTYLPVSSREESLAAINAAMKRIALSIRKALPEAIVTPAALKPENAITRMLVRSNGAQVKIEVTPVLRGCAFEPALRRVPPSVEESFGFAEMLVVSFADLYAGKIVAALDRQHPRDLFDVRGLLANEGIDGTLREAFIVYLLSHNRPMAELLAPTRKRLEAEFERGFAGMAATAVTIQDLEDAREALIGSIAGQMSEAHRRFLLSFERGEPDWSLLAVPGARDLPAVRWRQRNLDSLDKSARDALVSRLEAVLFPGPAHT
ncbi:nucleotidyl transferase AbiEii/AbiGii toxin family protein [uncultured Paludibaculum sp.]|uniref:nucleotidyl transferase AbiEii/AbiGii toxin family protein n=1 Tax=uncultured Paludibaculum sp. TaxID=1765020 RepID=UPI002AAA8785|nr:nucleotidyl transferase AbiEii/AbiGii toxin family protein [uncultured Paludibaculum sp.]